MSRQSSMSADVTPLLPPRFGVDEALIEAINHHHAGRSAEAEQLYRGILVSPPGHPVASYGLGLLCATQGRLGEAIDAYRHAIAIQPDFVDAHINLGTALLTVGRRDDAEALYRQAIAISPENAMAHGNLGKALQDLGRIDEAIAEYREAIRRQPDHATYHVNLGAAFLELRAWDDAVATMRQAIVLDPGNAMAHANLGTGLLHLGRRAEALAACRQAIALRPPGAATYASLGGALLELGAPREAVAACRHAVTLDPALASAHLNLSHAFRAMNRLKGATLAARRAVALRRDSADHHFHLAHVLLLQGEMDAGWGEYDWRWQLPDFAWITTIHGPFSQPRWTGEAIADKTILIYTEQGLGDIILFARYLHLVTRVAGRVIVAVHPPVHRLLATIKGISIVSILEAPLPRFDVHCPLASLPRVFATTLDNIPAEVPYLHSDPVDRAYWNNRIDGSSLRVGIVWGGNPATKRDGLRSPGLRSVMPLFSVPGVDFIVLQAGPGRQDLNGASLPPHVRDLGGEVADLADTAAIMSSLDLMLSSCTAPLHLAGALGVPTWAMIPFAPYFPWLLERTDSPWYPTMRLYRQEQPGQGWSGVVKRIAVDLSALVRAGSGRSQRVSLASRRCASPEHPSCRGMPEEPDVKSCQEANGIAMPGHQTDRFAELAACRGGLMLYNHNDIYIGASLRKYGEYSDGETVLFRHIVQPGMTVLDVGANIGVHTVDLSRLVGSTGAVHAFEPQRLMFQMLCANAALNNCINIFAHHAAIGATCDVLLVPSLDPGKRNNYGGVSLLNSRHGESVPVFTIDNLDLRACHFIKLDVEGMETEALRGAITTIGRFRPYLYVENDRQARSAELIGLLRSYGYRLYWHFVPLYRANNFRADIENIFGETVSVNMICIPSELPQTMVTEYREVTDPTDQWRQV